MIQNTISESDLQLLEKHKSHLRTAYYANYFRGLSRKDLLELYEIYLRQGGEKKNINCNTCVLKILRALAEIIFKK